VRLRAASAFGQSQAIDGRRLADPHDRREKTMFRAVTLTALATLTLAAAQPVTATEQANGVQINGYVWNGLRLNGYVWKGSLWNSVQLNGIAPAGSTAPAGIEMLAIELPPLAQ